MKNVNENNKMIAEFMGEDCEGYYMDFEYNDDLMICFHNSFEWIMPVVKKISESNIAGIEVSDLKGALITGNIELTYDSVVKLVIILTENHEKSYFIKNFELMEPKKIVTFMDAYRKGILYMVDKQYWEPTLLDATDEVDLLMFMSAPHLIFGIKK